MSDRAALEKLLTVSQARYDHQQQAFARIVAEEKRLRGELARLTEMGRANAQDSDGLRPMQAIGADLLWQGWLARAQTTLNMQLARVLAVKEFEQRKVRQAFGKVVALQDLIRDARKKQRAVVAKKGLDQAIEFSVSGRDTGDQ